MTDTIKFDAPEFYSQNSVVLTVPCTHKGAFLIVSDGDREAVYDGQTLKSPDEWRAAFSDGVIRTKRDEFEWRYNAWFSIYQNGEQVGVECFSLREALIFAMDLAYGDMP